MNRKLLQYQTTDGEILRGDTPREVIEHLRAGAWMQRADLAAYIRKTAYFAAMTSGKPVRGNTAENLLADLVTVGLLKPLH